MSPRYVVYAGVVWCGMGLMCVVAVSASSFWCESKPASSEQLCLRLACCPSPASTSCPTLYLGIAKHFWLDDMEFWNEAQITSWAGSVLWVPHHVAALIACFVAFLLLRHQADAKRWATGPVIVAGMAFASAAGMSVYVTFTFVVAVALWLLALIARKAWLEAAMFVGAGAVAFALGAAVPSQPSRSRAAARLLWKFALRPFSFGLYLAHLIGINLRTRIRINHRQCDLPAHQLCA